MVGRAKLDVLEERIESLRARQQGDAFAQFLKTLTDRQITEFRARLERGETPELVARDYLK